MAPYRPGQKVLIIAQDPMLAALIGSLVETAKLEAAFLRQGELPEQAIDRVRPVLLLLIDVEEGVAESELFLAKANRASIPVALFGSRRALDARRHWIEEREVPAYALPQEIDRFLESLERLRQGKELRSAGRRAANHVAPDHEFRDAKGTRWSVYDRRSGDGRREVDRQFVSETGESRHCMLSRIEAARHSSTDLVAQLQRSEPLPTA